MPEEEKKTEVLCVRIEEKWTKLLNEIKQQYGLDISTIVRLAIYFFTPRLIEALKQLELRAQIEILQTLDAEIYEKLREEALQKLLEGKKPASG